MIFWNLELTFSFSYFINPTNIVLSPTLYHWASLHASVPYVFLPRILPKWSSKPVSQMGKPRLRGDRLARNTPLPRRHSKAGARAQGLPMPGPAPPPHPSHQA